MAKNHSVQPNSHIRRRRTGCLTCRERRVRCGEEKPACKNCSRKARTCKWARDGDRFFQHRPGLSTRPEVLQQDAKCQDSTDEQNDENKAAVALQPSQTPNHSPDSLDAIEHSPTLCRSILKSNDPPNIDSDHSRSLEAAEVPYPRSASWPSSNSSDTINADDLSCWRSEVLDSFNDGGPPAQNSVASAICRSQSARLKDSIDVEHASPIPPNLEPNAEEFSDWRTIGASEFVVSALEGNHEMKLLQVYLRECAHWFDSVDGHRHYARKSVARMMNCPPWRAAALALSAKYLELQQNLESTPESLSLHLYQLAVQLAIDSISGRFDCVGTTAGCVVLAVYEMMTVTYRDWRRHLRGCTSIYSHNHWNGDSTGLIGASFWNYARIDIWAAFCAGTETMLSPDKWFNHPDKSLSNVESDEDRRSHVAIWLLARVNNLIHRTSSAGLPNHGEYEYLMNALVKWEELGANDTKALLIREADSYADEPFPNIVFASEGSIIAYMIWHVAMILLLNFKTSSWSPDRAESPQKIYQHARAACGIIMTNSHLSCVLVDAVHPLWICGRQLRSNSEKFAVLELLSQVERSTGWRTGWRANSLRELWRIG